MTELGAEGERGPGAVVGPPSHTELLGWLIAYLEVRFAEPLKPAKLTADNLDAFVVCASWVRLAASYAKATYRMVLEGVADAAAPTARALYEVWAELSYLLEHGDAEENARRVKISAYLEVEAFLVRAGYEPTDAALTLVSETLARYREQWPDLMRAVEEQRRARRFHWSGLTRTKLLESAFGPGARVVYGALSWDAHAVTTAIRDLEVDAARGKIQFGHYQDPEDLAEQVSWHVGGMVFYLYNRFAHEFGLAPIELPPGYSQEGALMIAEREFADDEGKVWHATTVLRGLVGAGAEGRRVPAYYRALRFSSGDDVRLLGEGDFPDDWAELDDRALDELRRRATPADEWA